MRSAIGPSPRASGPWQTAQDASYSARPASTYCEPAATQPTVVTPHSGTASQATVSPFRAMCLSPCSPPLREVSAGEAARALTAVIRPAGDDAACCPLAPLPGAAYGEGCFHPGVSD